MAFDMSKVRGITSNVVEAGMEKTLETLDELNFLVTRLPDAGYELGQMEIEVSVTSKITIHVKATRPTSDDKLNAILRDCQGKAVVTLIVNALLRANWLRETVKVGKLDLAEVLVALGAAPHVEMSWKPAASRAA